MDRTRRSRPRPWGAGLLALLTALLAACSTAPPAAPPASPAAATPSATGPAAVPNIPDLPQGWVESDTSFGTPLGTFYGTYTHPATPPPGLPALLVIGGSGAADRDGNQPPALPSMNTLVPVARWLAAAGVATLRYDKLGSGRTGLGTMTQTSLAQLTVDDYLGVNVLALAHLAAQPGVDRGRLMVLGHSEGGLFALLVAAGRPGTAAAPPPPVTGVVALAPLSGRLLDLLSAQIEAQVAAAERAGQLDAEQAAAYRRSLGAAIAAVRAGTPLPPDLPPTLAPLFAPQLLRYLRSEDAIDARDVAAALPAATRVLIACGEADVQVPCSDVQGLAAAAQRATSQVTFVTLPGVAHTLKQDPSRDPTRYNADLPFSGQLREALTGWVAR